MQEICKVFIAFHVDCLACHLNGLLFNATSTNLREQNLGLKRRDIRRLS